MLAELRITPVESDVSFARMIAEIVRILDASPLQYETHAMGSAIEGDIDDILDVVRRAHQVVRAHSGRVLIELAIDDRDTAQGELVRSLQHVEQLTGRGRTERTEHGHADPAQSTAIDDSAGEGETRGSSGAGSRTELSGRYL